MSRLVEDAPGVPAAVLRRASPFLPLRRIVVIQGERRVSADPHVMFTTVLGSCIAACLFDPEAGIGGMNHFLLAEPKADRADRRSIRSYGLYAMAGLIDEMLARGAMRHRLRARLYGGAAMQNSLRDIGRSNSSFARQYLRDQKVMVVGEDVGGCSARRVDFHAALGLARSRLIAAAPVAAAPHQRN